VTGECFDWLPLSALEDARIAETLGSAVELWRARWFVHGQYCASKPTLRRRGYRTVGRKAGWVTFGNAVAIAWPDDEGVGLAKHAMNAPKARTDLQPADKSLLQKYAELIALDLVTSVGAALKIPHASETHMASAPDPFLNTDGIEIELERHDAMPPVRIAIPAFALVPIRKSYVRSPSIPPLKPVSITSVFAAESLAFSTALGCAKMSIADIQALGIGDVIVLDTRLDESVSLLTQRSGRTIGFARVSQKDGRVRLVTSDAMGA
jgi:Type III flagellar switch regulator (C-ring) FliN C-term